MGSFHSTPPKPDLRRRLGEVGHNLRRGVLARRRMLCALCAFGAVFFGVRALVPSPAPTVSVTVAARDLPAGTTLTQSDIRTVEIPTASAPEHLAKLDYAVGRTVTGPVRRGEPVTDVRLVGAGLLEGYPGLVAVPVRLPDESAAALLRVGDEIDLLATDQRTGSTQQVGDDLPVIALPQSDQKNGAIRAGGRLVVVGATPEMSEGVAAAAATRYLTVTISR